MRIGLMVHEPLNDQSGGYLYDRKIAEYLRKSGNDVVIYTPPFDAAQIIEDDVAFLIEDELCHQELLGFNLHLKQASSIPLIALVHHLKYLEPIFKRQQEKEAETRFLEACDAVIANSNDTSRRVHELGVELPAVVAYPGCGLAAPDQDFTREQSRSSLNLLFVGILLPRKGTHVLLDALAELMDYRWRLRIIGDDTLDARYVGLLREKSLKLRDRVQFCGRVSSEELSAAYLDSDILILPSYIEGYGIVAAEAVLHLLPSIASNVGGIPEVIRDGREGILVNPGDKSALKQALRNLFEHPEHLMPLIEGCALRRPSLPTWAETGRVIEDFLLGFRHENTVSNISLLRTE